MIFNIRSFLQTYKDTIVELYDTGKTFEFIISTVSTLRRRKYPGMYSVIIRQILLYYRKIDSDISIYRDDLSKQLDNYDFNADFRWLDSRRTLEQRFGKEKADKIKHRISTGLKDRYEWDYDDIHNRQLQTRDYNGS